MEDNTVYKTQLLMQRIKDLEHKVLALEARVNFEMKYEDSTISSLKEQLIKANHRNEALVEEHKKWEHMKFKKE